MVKVMRLVEAALTRVLLIMAVQLLLASPRPYLLPLFT